MTSEEYQKLIANSKTIGDFQVAVTVNDTDYFTLFDGTQWKKVQKKDFTLGGEAATTFLQLEDTPSTRLGQAGKAVVVKADESGFEYKTIGEIVNLTKEDIETILGYMPVKSVNGNLPDASGNVTITVGDASKPPVDGTYADVNALLADQNNQEVDYFYEVTDASGFTSVSSGAAVVLLDTTTGTETDYTIIWQEVNDYATTSDLSTKADKDLSNLTAEEAEAARTNLGIENVSLITHKFTAPVTGANQIITLDFDYFQIDDVKGRLGLLSDEYTLLPPNQVQIIPEVTAGEKIEVQYWKTNTAANSTTYTKAETLSEIKKSKGSVSLIISGNVKPNVIDSTGILDLGNDPVIIVGGVGYALGGIHSDPAVYRNISLSANVVTSARKLYFNTQTKDFKCLAYSDSNIGEYDFLVGGIRKYGAYHYCSFPFEFTRNGEPRFLTAQDGKNNVSLIVDILGFKPRIDTSSMTLDLGPDPVLLVGDSSFVLKTIHTNSDKYRKIPLTSPPYAGSATKLFFDKTTKEFICYPYSETNLSTSKVLVGGIRKLPDGQIICSFPFELEEIRHRTLALKTSLKFTAHAGINFSGIAPENSLDGHRLAARAGFTYVETDIVQTLDGEIILMHDASINRTCKNASDYSDILTTINVAEQNLSDLRANYVLASPKERMRKQIPTLEEFLNTCKDCDVFPIMDIKDYGFTTANVTTAYNLAVDILGDGNFGFTSFTDALLDHVRTLSDKPVLWYINEVGSAHLLQIGNAAYYPPNIRVNQTMARDLKSQGIELHTFTTPTELFDKLLKDGVTGISTNDIAPNINDRASLQVITTDGNWDDVTTTGIKTGDKISLAIGQKVNLKITKKGVYFGAYFLRIELKGRAKINASRLIVPEVDSLGKAEIFTYQVMIKTYAPTVEIEALDETDILDIKFNYVEF